MDHPDLTVSNFMGNSIVTQDLKKLGSLQVRAATFTKFGKRLHKSSNNRSDSVYTELPDLIFFHYADW